MHTFDSVRRLVRAGEWKDPMGAFLLFVRTPRTSASMRKFRTDTDDGDLPSVPPLSAVLAAPETQAAPHVKRDTSPYEAFVFIGRAVTADIQLDDESISKSHAAFQRRGEDWFVKDVRSRNGTYVDGRRLNPGEEARVHSGTQVTFGLLAAYFVELQYLRRLSLEPSAEK